MNFTSLAIASVAIAITILIIVFVWIWLDETSGAKKHRPFEESYKFIINRFVKFLLWFILMELVACVVLFSLRYKAETNL
jgi:hypothetical protein